MASVGYSAQTEAAVALAAATVKTILGVKAHANSGLQVKSVQLMFDGVTASAVPALVELGYCTWATNSPGTNSTSTTPRQKYGRALTAGFTSGRNWTSEPTVITPIKEWLIPVFNGVLFYDFPLGLEPDSALGEGFVLRVTAPAIVNARATIDVERV